MDDNKDFANTLARMLKLKGNEVETVYDGPDGIETARSYRPEVVLLDIGLPSLDGYEVARQLRREDNLKHVTIIAISGYGQEEDRRRSREAGMDHHLTKPLNFDDVTRLLTSSSGTT